MQTSVSRRRFLQSIGIAAAAAPWSTRALGAANGKVRHASIGSANMAFSDIQSFAKHPAFELVAVADVDLCLVGKLQQQFPKVRIYQNWQELLRKERRNIDSINVSTPDHMHAAIALAAMREKKHVYVQKPLAATVREARLLAEAARRHRVVTQMGIQISSTLPQRLGEAMVQSGVVGRIREVHSFSDKSWGDESPLPSTADPVPPTLDWDLWLGVAPDRPFLREKYHPGQWRRRVGFGTGTLGDMGCHILSPPFRGLALTAPVSVTSYGPAPTKENWATRARIKWVFPGTKFTAADTLDLWWYDGGERPPAELLDRVGDRMPGQGSIFVGTDGLIVLPHVKPDPFILPEEKAIAFTPPTLEPRDHYAEFLDAVLAGGASKVSTSFDYSGPLTEVVLLGNVAAFFPGETLTFDAKALRFPGKPEADALLTREYRKGWRLKV